MLFRLASIAVFQPIPALTFRLYKLTVEL